MNQIALPDLHDRTAEILEEVRKGTEEYVVTDEGRPIARLSPMTAEVPVMNAEEAWTRYSEAVEEVDRGQPEPWRTQDVLDEIRRS